ncbi:hypothetical protein BDV95DRAFT_597678 [Massariosphaeria phaeospora]|uniref:MARVEL domain-containing protein n=1 Tax=Massariosphaeria phaeospora TaxID=100035 RepID=A0A7C8M2B0_9PLEO|nr:hypothetical protein BDV95DRAFT_597678 [Massariosphaeria phaeospora]
MSERARPAHVLPVPQWTLIIHAVQLLFAIIVLGLAAYGVSLIPYNALIFSLVVCIVTLGIAAYMVATQLFLHALYNMYIALAGHALMIIFWIVNLGLTANLAKLWSAPVCDYYWGYSYCVYDDGFQTYYGALAASAFFCGAQFALWVLSTIILVIYINKHRTNGIAATTQPHQAPPPQYTNDNGQAVPMEKYNHNAVPAPAPQPGVHQPQQPYSTTQTPQPHYAQPVPQQPHGQYPPPQTMLNYQQDPVPRTDTVSPVSHAGGYTPAREHTSELGSQHQHQQQHQSSTQHYNSNVSELSSPQQSGNYNPNVSELSSPQHAGSYNPNVSELSTR